MINIAIVEDDQHDMLAIHDYINSYKQEHDDSIMLFEFTNAEDFLKQEKLFQVLDLLFLDIELPGMSGMDLAISLRKKGISCLIVFATNMVQYAVQGYDVAAIDFIVKPITQAVFHAKFSGYLRTIHSKKKTILIKKRDEVKRCLISDILFVEVESHTIRIFTKSSEEEFSGTLKQIEEELSGNGFAKCNKCYLVNLKYVESICKDEVKVAGHQLQISRREKKQFMEAFARYEDGGYHGI